MCVSVCGRRKIPIEFIEDKSRRHITFSKRKAGIMKKAYELSTLTGAQVCGGISLSLSLSVCVCVYVYVYVCVRACGCARVCVRASHSLLSLTLFLRNSLCVFQCVRARVCVYGRRTHRVH